MPNTIQSYFKSASPAEKIPSSGATTPCPTQADTSFSSQAPEQKKYKITACNGRELSFGQPEKKKVKREATLEDLEEGSHVSRRNKTRAKLAKLPDFPLDVLFEVSDL